MTALQIDTEATSGAAGTWVAWGDSINRAQLDVRADSESLMLTPQAVWAASRLAAAAAELWTLGAFVRLVVAQAEDADGLGPIGGATIDELLWLAGGRISTVATCPAGSFSPLDGELGQTYRAELRSPWSIEAADDTELGRELLMRALRDTDGREHVRTDEFELVQLADGRYLVVLPGVTDLTNPTWRHDDKNRTVRDLDTYAAGSALSTSVGGNEYARMVWESLIERGVPLGSELVIVGHSFGADTALDLAADPVFNGPGGFAVTHAVAAAYDSAPQLDDVPDRTKVLVLQNRRDVPVRAEGVIHDQIIEPYSDLLDLADDAADLDLGGALSSTASMIWGSASTGVSDVLASGRRIADVADEIRRLDPIDAVEDAVLPITGTSRPGESQVVVVFDGDFDGAGHHQSNYVDYLAGTSDAAVLAFLGSVGGMPSIAGTAVAVDVSVPRDADGRAEKS